MLGRVLWWEQSGQTFGYIPVRQTDRLSLTCGSIKLMIGTDEAFCWAEYVASAQAHGLGAVPLIFFPNDDVQTISRMLILQSPEQCLRQSQSCNQQQMRILRAREGDVAQGYRPNFRQAVALAQALAQRNAAIRAQHVMLLIQSQAGRCQCRTMNDIQIWHPSGMQRRQWPWRRRGVPYVSRTASKTLWQDAVDNRAFMRGQ